MHNTKIGIIAGTPIDTEFGTKFFEENGFDTIGIPISKNPSEQSKLQILSKDKLYNLVKEKAYVLKEQNAKIAVIYCNSLSAAIDVGRLSSDLGIKIITPLTVYKTLAQKYKRIGIIAANNQSSSGIERTIQSSNPHCDVIGLGILPVVEQIEDSVSPNNIIINFSLDKIVSFFENINVDVIILGCTHFTYIYNEMKTLSTKILDPADIILETVIKNI